MTLRQANDVADLELKWANLYAESAMLQYDITCGDMKNAILTESASNDDALYIMEGAVSDFGAGLIEAIKKLFESVGKFLAQCGQKISEFVSGNKFKSQMSGLESIKNNPDAKKVTVEIEDPNEKEKNLKYYKTLIAKYRAKIKSGKALSDRELEELKDAESKCKSPVKKIVVSAVGTAIAVGTTLTALKVNKISNEIKGVQTDYQNVITNNLTAEKESTDNADIAKATKELANAQASAFRLSALANIEKASLMDKLCSALARFLNGVKKSDYSDDRRSDVMSYVTDKSIALSKLKVAAQNSRKTIDLLDDD